MTRFFNDFRLALRVLWKDPLFSLTSIATMALGLGASCAIFSVVNAVLLRPLPYKDAGRLVRVWETNQAQNIPKIQVSPANYLDWRRENTAFERIAAFEWRDFSVTGGVEPELVHGATVAWDLFSLLGVRPLLGRVFLPADDRAGAARVALIGEGYWRRHFSSDPQVLGKSLNVAKEPYTIVGVLPASCGFPDHGELWLPLALDDAAWRERAGRYLHVVARIKRGVTFEQAQARMAAVAARLERQYPEADAGAGVHLVTLQDDMVGEIRPALLLLSGAVGLVLLVACANVANLLLARATSRQGELAIRTALGASRGGLMSQLWTEYLVLALVGGVLGVVLAQVGLRAILALKPADISQLEDVAVNAKVLVFGLLLSLFTGLLFGLAPAVLATRTNLREVLNEGGSRTTGGLRTRRLQGLFVSAQIALALVLLIGASLLIQSYRRLQSVNPGFDPRQVYTMLVVLPEEYHEKAKQGAFFRRVLERVQGIAGVQQAAAVSTLPMTSLKQDFEFSILGRPEPRSGEEPDAAYDAVSPRYFAVMGVPIVRGRAFNDHDDSSAPGVVIVNATMARRFWANQDPIGRRIKIGDKGPNPREIVGICGDVKRDGLSVDTLPEMYVPYLQRPRAFMTLVARTAANPAGLASAMRQAVWAEDKSLPIPKSAPMQQVLSDSLAKPRFNLVLLGLFAAIALVLAAMGVYGVTSYGVNQRTHEIGLRMALGAAAVEVRWLVIKQALALAVKGIIVGLLASMLLVRLLEHLLYATKAFEPLTLLGIPAVFLVVTVLASYLPATRAVRIDPLVAMRSR